MAERKLVEEIGIMAIKNIIFDLAGVILNLDLEKDRQALCAIGYPDFYSLKDYPHIFKPTMDYLNGLMPAELFCSEVLPYCKDGITDREILDAMDAVIAEIPFSRLELITCLRKRYKIYLLSNIYDTAWKTVCDDMVSKGYDVDMLFDGVFLSYKMQMAKPDENIFMAVIEETGLKPEETLYFDDSLDNVETGVKMGFISYQVKINQLEESIDLCLNNNLLEYDS